MGRRRHVANALQRCRERVKSSIRIVVEGREHQQKRTEVGLGTGKSANARLHLRASRTIRRHRVNRKYSTSRVHQDLQGSFSWLHWAEWRVSGLRNSESDRVAKTYEKNLAVEGGELPIYNARCYTKPRGHETEEVRRKEAEHLNVLPKMTAGCLR